MTPLPAPSAVEPLERQVVRLLGQWRAETAHLSSATRVTGHPAYQELIALGSAALPFLFRDLERTRDGHLAKALGLIPGAHPVSPEERGKVRKVADAWLRWAGENGYQW